MIRRWKMMKTWIEQVLQPIKNAMPSYTVTSVQGDETYKNSLPQAPTTICRGDETIKNGIPSYTFTLTSTG